MEQFTFELQRKFTQWESGEFTVTAETYEEAVAKAKEMVTDYSANDEICNGDGWIPIYDTCEYINPWENNGFPTEELVDKDNNTIWHNGDPEWKEWNGIDSLQAIVPDFDKFNHGNGKFLIPKKEQP
jgi:hypothetical protein